MSGTCSTHGTRVALSHPDSTSRATPLSAAALGLVLYLSDFLQDQLVHRQVSDRSPESGILSFQRFQPLRLAHLHPAIGLAPALVGLRADTWLFTPPTDVLALAQQHLRFT